VSKSTLEGFPPKDATQKTESFRIHYLLKTSANQQKQLCNDAFHFKTSQSAKNQLDPAKNKNGPKTSHMPFLHETLQLHFAKFLGTYLLSSTFLSSLAL